MKRWTKIGTAALTAGTALLAGCDAAGGDEKKLMQLGQEEQATIKVMSMFDESYFFQLYGALFSAKYPNIDIQVASTQGAISYGPDTDYNKQLYRFIDEQKPDVLLLTLDQYEKMAEEGRLYELDSVIKQDKFDVDGILPSVIETIKSRSGARLYGLAPGFSSQALFYNKTLFDSLGVPPPQDGMTWEQTIELAKRFGLAGNGSSRPSGLSLDSGDSVFRFIQMLGATKGLSYIDPAGATLTIKSDGWKRSAQLALDAFKSKAIYRSDQQFLGGTMEDYYKQDPFIGGKTAMSISGAYFIDSLKQAKALLKEMPEWDLVSLPADPGNPESLSTISVNQIFAVNAQSANPRAAWEFVKYVGGDEYARVTSKSSVMGNLSSRVAYVKDPEGRNIEAFFKGKGGTSSASKALSNVPNSFIEQLHPIAEAEFQEVLDGKKSVDDALQAIQDKGQAELTKAKQAQERSKESK
ncbi:ABC transporter substrate-binding protein [Paenibacillus ginsengarvi]|uniref:ABC transporter substrate-binding protein n=1 Tax=Paenibacillus ginsengarvi TaxID=400777 RepID=UPI0013158B56|nr:extracellular solute-binding protein [Paenibacillus ginsengarvi]